VRNKIILIISVCIALSISACVRGKEEKKQDIPSGAKLTYAKDMSISPESFWTDNTLKDAFANYWLLRFDRKIDDTFKMEAPYFQEMANFKRYRTFMEGAKDDLVEVELKDRIQVTERFVVIKCTIRLNTNSSEGIRNVSIADYWVYSGKKWYHVIRDSIVFPDES
jgi:hypothetical protein